MFVSLWGAASAANEMPVNDTALKATASGDEISLTLNENSNGLLELSDDNDKLSGTVSGSTVQDIKNYFDNGNVQEGDTVYLGNKTYSSTWSEWSVDNIINVNVGNIIISGGSTTSPNGFSTINANNAKLFNLIGNGIILKNIIIKNSNGGNGPGSAVTISGSDCSISDCVFDNCQFNKGGAIYTSASASNTLIENCNFTNNLARWGGSGGAIYLEGSDSTVSNCNFENNRAESQGGAIYSTGSGLAVEECTFSGNTANSGNDIYSTGSNSVIEDSSFKGTLNFDVSKESNNLIASVTVDFGSAIAGSIKSNNLNYWGGKSKISVVFTGSAYNLVGVNVTVEIRDSANQLIANKTILTDSNGKISYDYSNIPMGDYTYNVYYTNNPSLKKEGKLYNVVSGTTFTDIQNAINAASAGDTLNLQGITYTNPNHQSIQITKSITIIGTDGTVLDAQGYSGIFTTNYQAVSDIVFENINFINGKKEGNGAAISLDQQNNNVKIINCNFSNNQISNWGSGGAIYTVNSNNNIIIENCIFENNTAKQNGGAVYSASSHLSINNCLFERNTAAQNGNDVYSSGSNSIIANSSFQGECNLSASKENKVLTFTLTTDLSKAIYGNANLDNLSFWDGKSKTPIDASSMSKIILSGKNVTVEIYKPDGTLYANVTKLTDSNGEITYDYSDIPLGDYTYKAYYADDSSIKKEGDLYNFISGNTFTDIQNAINAASAGDTLYLKGITYTNLDHRNIEINKAITIIGIDGTVLDAQEYSRIFTTSWNVNEIALENITLTNGKTSENGGAILLNGAGNVKIINLTFVNNEVAADGGAICVNYGSSNILIENSTFKDNSATSNGGAINSYQADLTVNECYFENNNAQKKGNDIYSNGDNSIIANSTFTGTYGLTGTGQSNTLILTLSLDLSNAIAGNAKLSNLSSWDGENKTLLNVSNLTNIKLQDKKLLWKFMIQMVI